MFVGWFWYSMWCPTPLLCDNTGAIQIANDPVKHELTKHIGVDAFFTRSHCHQKTIALQYVPSELQLAYFFTKAQTREQHRLHLLKLNASDPPLPPWVWRGVLRLSIFLWVSLYSYETLYILIWLSINTWPSLQRIYQSIFPFVSNTDHVVSKTAGNIPDQA